jgi:hypothetical protein
MDLRTILTNTTWGDAAKDINSNFNIVNEALESGEQKNSLAKGIFPTLDDLKSAYPNPEVGFWAYVGTSFPAYYYTWNGTSWVRSDDQIMPEDVSLYGYITSEQVSDPTRILL